MLSLNRVHVRFGRKAVLSDASIGVEPGKVLAIVGENGAGKSTALRTLAGELRPASGSACLDGKALSEWSPVESARRRSVVPQHAQLTFSLSVLDVVLLGRYAYHRGHPTEADRACAQSALRQVSLGGFEQRPYTQLSGGERQRVHVARSLAQLSSARTPSYWLLDEPTASLDIAHQHSVLALARRMARDSVGVAVVLHDLNLACMYSDLVAVMKAGQVLASGPIELLTDAQLVESALGVPVRYVSVPNRALPMIVVEPGENNTDTFEGES